MWVNLRTARFFGSILDEPPVHKRPENKDGCGNEEYRPRGINPAALHGKKLLEQIPKPAALACLAHFGHADYGLPPIEGKIDTEGYEGPEYSSENSALSHMKPVGLYLNDGNRPVALKIHVDRVDCGKRCHSSDLHLVGYQKVSEHPHRNVGKRGAQCRNDNAFLAPNLIHQGTVHEEGYAINEGANSKNPPKILVGHHRAERSFGDGQIIPSHVEEGVGHAQGQPIDEPAGHEPAAMLQRVIVEVQTNYRCKADANHAEVHAKSVFRADPPALVPPGLTPPPAPRPKNSASGIKQSRNRQSGNA